MSKISISKSVNQMYIAEYFWKITILNIESGNG
jgi:hypothetical protein